MHLFGLTGGIASGKSTVAARLAARGVPVIDADVLARDVVEKGTSGLAEIVRSLGQRVLAEDGALDRKKLAREVFGNDEKRRVLGSIVHPRVAERSLQNAHALREAGHPLACYEAALLVENGVADTFRPLVVVSAPEHVQVARACARDAALAEDVTARVRAQLSLADKIRAADFVIENNSSIDALQVRTDEVLDAICRRLSVDRNRYTLLRAV
jgi:dephospho-CoA kinase